MGFTLLSVDAASKTISGKQSGTYVNTYKYSYNYKATIGYHSPGDGKIYSAGDMTISNATCATRCYITAKPSSKTMNSTKTAVVYRVAVEVSVYTETGLLVYVGSQTDVITISSPGPSRSTDEPLVTVEHGKMYYDTETAKKYEIANVE